MHKRLLCAGILAGLLLMTACGGNTPGAVNANGTADPSATATSTTATTTAAAGATTQAATSPSPAPTASATPAPDNGEVNLSSEFKDFVEMSNYIVVGKFVKFKEEFNSVRDNDDEKKEHPDAFVHHNLYEFEVEKCLKGGIKAGTKIVVALETESKMNLPTSKLNKCARYVEPKLGEAVVQQLDYYDETWKHYYTSSYNEPQRFTLVNDKLFIVSNDKVTVEKFAAGKTKPGGEGVPLSALEEATNTKKK